MRLSGPWQWGVDDRILELLKSESWSMPSVMKLEPHIHATERQIRARCLKLYDAGLVEITFETDNHWRVEITTEGKQYLEGEIDVRLYKNPRSEAYLMEMVERLMS